MTIVRRRPLVAAFALLAVLVVAIPAFGGRASAVDSQVYVVHGIPGVPVDVYAGGELLLPGFQPGTSAGPVTVPEGSLPVLVFGAITDPPAAAADRADAPVINQTLPVPGGANVSVVANVEGGSPNLKAFPNDLTAVPEGSSRVTVRHVADAPAVNVLVNGQVAIPALAPGAEASAVLPAGTYDVQVQLTDGTPLPALSPGSTDIPAAKNVIVYAIGSATDGDFPLGLAQQVLDVPTTPAPIRRPISSWPGTRGASATPRSL
jgi:hypothetical protein